MPSPQWTRRPIAISAWLITGLIFVVSFAVPTGYNPSAVYTLPVLAGLWSKAPRLGVHIAAAASVLVLVQIALHPLPSPAGPFLFNRTINVGVLWLAALATEKFRGRVAAQHVAETARQQSAKALEDTKYALDQSAIVATTDVKGDITYVNEKFCEISKYSRAELIGQNHRILNSNYHPLEFFKALYRTIAGGHVWRGEIRNRAKDGSLYWVDTTIVPLLDPAGKPYQYIAIRYDITERKQAEAKLRDQAALAQLGKMAAVVAHEVRNPLAGIRGALQVIAKRFDPQSAEKKVAAEIITRVDTLNDIVQDLLLFARPKPPVVSPVVVSELAHETVSLLQADPVLKEIRVRVDVGDATVSADRELLKMVLLNLLINGAQAMQGRGALEISLRTVEGWHELRVADEGPGIPPDVRDHLFEPFFTTKHRGTGLGLATARRIIDAHGGTIELHCPDSGGTVATIRLPS